MTEVVYAPKKAETVLGLEVWGWSTQRWMETDTFPDTASGLYDAQQKADELARMGTRVQVVRRKA